MKKTFEATMNAGKDIFDMNATTKWFKESSKIMTDLYDKQVNFLLNSYSDFMGIVNENMNKAKDSEFGADTFHSSVGVFIKNMEGSSSVMKKMFASIIDMLGKETDKDFVKEVSDLMQNTYNKQTEQLLKFNKNLLHTEMLQNTISLNKEVSDKLQKDLQKNLEASNTIIKSIFDSYTKETDFSTQSGKKMLDEIFFEIDVVTKNNMKFWTNWFDEVYSNNKKTGNREKTAKNGQHL